MRKTFIGLGLAALFAIGPLASRADEGLHVVSVTLAQIKNALGSGYNAILDFVPTANTVGALEGGHIWYDTSHTMHAVALLNGGAWEQFNIDGNPLLLNSQSGGPVRVATALSVGSTSAATASTAEVALAKITASGTAPGAGFLKFAAVAGTNSGTCKVIAYAGTSTTPVTIVDNVGSGC